LHNINLQGIRNFKGLKKAVRSVSEIHSYTLDLGFALGLLKQCKSRDLSFHVDGAGYRPAKLSSDEWREIADSYSFHLKPRYKNGGVFHSKAWIFKNSLLLGSANLSIREARENLNFWCWMPKFISGKFPKNESFTVFWDLNKQKPIIKDTPLNTIKSALAGIKMMSMVIVSPQPPSKKVLRAIGRYLSEKGDCLFFLRTKSHGLKSLPNRNEWTVRNFIPSDKSNGLHGKAFYGEWDTKGKSGAIMYVGSANFTETAFTGKNIETGILIKAEGNRQVAVLRQALSSLLGKNGTISKNEKAWATERFDGRWEEVWPPDNRQETEGDLFLSKEDIALSKFMDGLWAECNCLHFPVAYGGKDISKAELKLGDYITRHWRKRKHAKHIFEGVIWSPDARLNLVLKGGKTVNIDLPPLEGLMEGQKKGSELIDLLFNHTATAGLGNGYNNTYGDLSNLCIYSDLRVLVPWQTFVDNDKSHLFYNKKELKVVLKTIHTILKEPLEKDMNRKLNNFAFCIESLIKGDL